MIAWDNLWKQFCFTPGTAGPRIALTAWQFFLMAVPAIGMRYWGWPGFGIGAVVAFESHELFFALYSRFVARIEIMDDGDVVGVSKKSDYSFERWIGPVC